MGFRRFAVMLLLLPGTASASSLGRHREITEAALDELGWNDPAAREAVVEYDQAADLARLPGSIRSTSALLFPVPGRRIETLGLLAATAPFNSGRSSGFHFNGLYRYEAVAERWQALEAWVDATAGEIERGAYGPWRSETELCLLGMVSHAVQDFYAHSNWVEILETFVPEAAGPESLPLWEELVEGEGDWMAHHPRFPASAALARLRVSNRWVSPDDRLGGLQTGRIRGPAPAGILPWRHRHKDGIEGKAAGELARRATVLWIRRIEARLGGRASSLDKGTSMLLFDRWFEVARRGRRDARAQVVGGTGWIRRF